MKFKDVIEFITDEQNHGQSYVRVEDTNVIAKVKTGEDEEGNDILEDAIVTREFLYTLTPQGIKREEVEREKIDQEIEDLTAKLEKLNEKKNFLKK